MHDLKQIRQNPQILDAALARRGLKPESENILRLDEIWLRATREMQKLQEQRNEKSELIGKLKREKKDTTELMAEVAKIKEFMAGLEAQEAGWKKDVDDALAILPNIPAPDVPDGKDENDNVELRTWGTVKNIPNVKDHADLGAALGMMDFETAAKLSGARFVVLKGALARMERALGQFMLDTHTREFGYTECSVPILVNANALYGTSNLPKFEEDLFKTNTGHYLIPTAEVSLTNFVNDSIVGEEKLPMRLTALTPCFRSEAGSAGKDTKGMLRQHQFYKVEMVSVTAPEDSEKEHERMVSAAENILQKLEIPYRVIVLCTGDMGFASRKTYDIEAWIPAQNKYREISSCSNCWDFQARRMNARLKRVGAKGTEFVHTLNGSGIAVGRALIAVMENYQQPDGSIVVPNVLRPYMGGLEKISV